MVRDLIVHKPKSRTVNMILTMTQEREMSLMMKDQAFHIGSDSALLHILRDVFKGLVQAGQVMHLPGRGVSLTTPTCGKSHLELHPSSCFLTGALALIKVSPNSN